MHRYRKHDDKMRQSQQEASAVVGRQRQRHRHRNSAGQSSPVQHRNCPVRLNADPYLSIVEVTRDCSERNQKTHKRKKLNPASGLPQQIFLLIRSEENRNQRQDRRRSPALEPHQRHQSINQNVSHSNRSQARNRSHALADSYSRLRSSAFLVANSSSVT